MADEADQLIDLATRGAEAQLRLSAQSLANQLDATDRILAQEAARAITRGADLVLKSDPLEIRP